MLIAAFITSGITLAGLIAGSRTIASRQYRHWHRTTAPLEQEKISCR